MYNAHRYCILSKLGFENPALQIVPIKKRIVAGECHVHMLKSVNLQYITLVCWDAGTKDSLTKRLMLQALFFKSVNLQYNTLVHWYDGTKDSSTNVR